MIGAIEGKSMAFKTARTAAGHPSRFTTKEISMLRGYTLPRTPSGRSALAPPPPWHYAGNCLAIEFEADAAAVRALLPAPLDFASARCAAYFIEWQFATDEGEEPLDPVN